jgi:hypothetical protein
VLQQSIASDGQAFTIAVVITNGAYLGADQVMIAPPGSTLHLRSPALGASLAIVVRCGPDGVGCIAVSPCA